MTRRPKALILAAMAGGCLALIAAPIAEARGGGGRGGGGGGGGARAGGGGGGGGGRTATSVNRGSGGGGRPSASTRPSGGGGGGYGRPLAGAVAFGAVAGLTAAAIGSTYYSLPPTGCSPYPYASYTYYHCGSAWYQPQYQGTQVTYVTVEAPQ